MHFKFNSIKLEGKIIILNKSESILVCNKTEVNEINFLKIIKRIRMNYSKTERWKNIL